MSMGTFKVATSTTTQVDLSRKDVVLENGVKCNL